MNLDDALRAIPIVEQRLKQAVDECGPWYPGDRDWHARRAVIMDLCAVDLTAQVDAQIRDRWDGCQVRIAGVTSSSTSGMEGALRNWLSAARRKAESAVR